MSDQDHGQGKGKKVSKIRSIHYHQQFMVRSGPEWSAGQVIVGLAVTADQGQVR